MRIEGVNRYSRVIFPPDTRSRGRESSSRDVTSRVRWHEASADQWPLTARASNLTSTGRLLS